MVVELYFEQYFSSIMMELGYHNQEKTTDLHNVTYNIIEAFFFIYGKKIQ
jgi:hypothetical protein